MLRFQKRLVRAVAMLTGASILNGSVPVQVHGHDHGGDHDHGAEHLFAT